MDEQRIIELETRLAYQEQAIAELSDVLADEQRQLDRLQNEKQALEARLQSMSDALPAEGAAADERPPHY